MKISEAAKLVGLPTKTVRYYADIDLVAPASRTEAGYRQYDQAAIRKLSFVKRARAFGFSLEECRKLLALYEDEYRTSSDVRAIAIERLADLAIKRRELEVLHNELDFLVKSCSGDKDPECPILNQLSVFDTSRYRLKRE